mgnify:CR=1 FL=1
MTKCEIYIHSTSEHISQLCTGFSMLAAQNKLNGRRKPGLVERKTEIIPGADQTNLYINYLKGKNIGMVINETSGIGKNLTLSVDTFLKLGIAVKKIKDIFSIAPASNTAGVGLYVKL